MTEYYKNKYSASTWTNFWACWMYIIRPFVYKIKEWAKFPNTAGKRGKMLPKLSKSKRWLSVSRHFSSARFAHFSRIPHFCCIFLLANSPFLPDFSLRRISGQVLANLERRCGQVERSGLQKPGSSRNILETCGISASVCSALQSKAQCNVEMKKKSQKRVFDMLLWYRGLSSANN